MAEPRVVRSDETGSHAPDPTANGTSTGHDASNGNGSTHGADAVIRVLRPEVEGTATLPPTRGPANPIAWLAPAEPSFVVLRDDLRDDLYDDLRDDLADDLRDDLRQDLRGDLRSDLRADLGAVLRADLDTDLEDLREELYEEVDDLRDDVFPEPDVSAPAQPIAPFLGTDGLAGVRARRIAFVAASIFALALIAAIVLVWQRADTAEIIASRPEPVVAAPPDVDAVMANVDRLDQQLAGLLSVSASPSTPNDVSLQIAALREELAGVKGCLLAVRRAVDDGVDTASAIEYC